MTSSSAVRRRLRMPSQLATGVLVVATVLAAGVSAVSATPAPVATILQSDPTQGTTMLGQAFSIYLQLSGNNGAVTYTQTAGAPNLTVLPTGEVVAPASLTAGNYQASGTDKDKVGGAGTWSFTLIVVAPAPSSFAPTAVNVYQSEYNYAQQVGQGSSLESVSQYQQQVSQLPPLGLAEFYQDTQQAPEWSQIPAVLQSAASALPTSSGAAGLAQPGSSSPSSSNGKVGLSQTNASANTAATTSAPALYQPGCAEGKSPGDQTVFAFQIIVDAASTVAAFARINVAAALGAPPGEKEAATVILTGVSFAAQVVLSAATIILHFVAYFSSSGASCQSNNLEGYAKNIDNTTVATYNLLTSADNALTQVQATASATDQDVQQGVGTLENQLTSLQTSLSAAITQDTQAIQFAVGTDTQGVLSQLQTDQNALQQDAATVQQDLSQLQRRVEIENALTSTSSSAPVPLELPGNLGGFLTLPSAAPPGSVSVQSVVEGDMQALQSAGVTLPTSATNNCNSATNEVTPPNNQWLQAYADFRACYRAFANLPSSTFPSP